MSDVVTDVPVKSKRETLWDDATQMFLQSAIIAPKIVNMPSEEADNKSTSNVLTNKIVATIDELDLFNTPEDKAEFMTELNSVIKTTEWNKIMNHPAVQVISNLAFPLLSHWLEEKWKKPVTL